MKASKRTVISLPSSLHSNRNSSQTIFPALFTYLFILFLQSVADIIMMYGDFCKITLEKKKGENAVWGTVTEQGLKAYSC